MEDDFSVTAGLLKWQRMPDGGEVNLLNITDVNITGFNHIRMSQFDNTSVNRYTGQIFIVIFFKESLEKKCSQCLTAITLRTLQYAQKMCCMCVLILVRQCWYIVVCLSVTFCHFSTQRNQNASTSQI